MGRSSLWVWDKTSQTLDVVRRLYDWETNNMTKVVRRLEVKYPDSWELEYMELALRKIGLSISRDDRRWSKVWQQRLRDKLKLHVTIIERKT